MTNMTCMTWMTWMIGPLAVAGTFLVPSFIGPPGDELIPLTSRPSFAVDSVPPTTQEPVARGCLDAFAVPHVAPMPTDASWLLTWDDSVDGVTTGHKQCRMSLRMTNGVIGGTFDGPVLGETRAASIVGDLVDINGEKVVTFRQDEDGYACVYAGRVDDNEIVGTWFDTRGAQGDFRMNQPVESARAGM